ncbi:MAG TPA: adenylate/guanylate cyclase domain-containing protein [Candidatus Limnocylindria bacterium]|jgi:pimeloyl-ACP methyl ester carboxylesterase
MAPPVHFARSGDLQIAYQITGDGPVDLVWAAGAASSIDLFWEQPRFVRVFERLATFTRFIIFDKRGTGLSDRPDHLATLEERIDDIRAVMDACGSERAHLLGFSEGGSMAMLFAATYPGRTRSLILHGTMPRWSWAPDWPWGRKAEAVDEFWRRYAEQGYELDYDTEPLWRRWAGPELWNDAAFRDWNTRSSRSGGSPAARHALEQMNDLLDVRSLLPTIGVPTLVIVREDDPVAPVDAVREWAAKIPNARVKVVRGVGHLFVDSGWEEWVAAVEQFVTGTTSRIRTDRFLATLVSADIVGSTELIARIGDQAWRDVLDRHYELATRRLETYAGVEVDRAGDGILARFDGPARAISWARSLLTEDRTIGLETRAGVHTGEVELAGTGVRGMAVHITARVSALAGPGEVLVSSTVKDLVGGAGFVFVDRGTHVLKGVPEPKQVFAVA